MISLRCATVISEIYYRLRTLAQASSTVVFNNFGYSAQIGHGYDRDTPWKGGTRILNIESEASSMIRHDTLPIFKYMCIIESW